MQSPPAPQCPQVVDPGIDFMAHVLLQQLAPHPGTLAVGIKPSVYSLLQLDRPLMVLVTTDSCGAKDHVLTNLSTMCSAMGVPVVYTLSRRHMGEACKLACPISAVAVCEVLDERSRMLLASIAHRAARAYGDWIATAAAGIAP